MSETVINFYIVNENEQVTQVLSTDKTGSHIPVYVAEIDEKIVSYDVLTLVVPADAEGVEEIREDYTIVFEDVKGWREYSITEIEDVDGDNVETTITAELSSVELLDEVIEEELRGTSNNPEEILRKMVAGTRWSVGYVDPSIYNSNFGETVQYMSVLEGIDRLSTDYKCEVSFSYVIRNNVVSGRSVNLYKEVGSDLGKRFEIDKDVTEIARTVSTADIKTAIIPYGSEPEEGEERFTIKDIVWSKAKGDPVDKPKGQSWLGNPEALAEWGKQGSAGKRHRYIAQEIDTETPEMLATMAWVELGKYRDPKVTYEAKVVDLYTLTGDKELRHEYVSIGDRATIIDNYFATPLVNKTRVVELTRDLLDPTNNTVVLGHSKQYFRVQDIADDVENVAGQLSAVNKGLEIAQQAADGKAVNYFGSVKPAKPAEGDIWFRPHPDKPNEMQMLSFDGLLWQPVVDTSKMNEVEKELLETVGKIDEAKQSADSAVEKADQAIEEAGFAKVDAGKAQEDAAKAISDANKAATDAGTAISTANTAKTNAGTALTTAQTSLTNSGTALDKAGQALSKATATETETGKLTTSYNELTQTVGLKADKTEVSTIKGTVTQHSLDITANATALGLKADKTVTDIINQTVAKHTTDIKATADGLAMKAEKALVDSLNGTVDTHTSQIKATADGLGLKADKSLVDTVKGTVDTHTAQIKATSDGLALKAEKSLVDTINGTVNTHTSQIKATSDGLGLKADKTLVDTVKGTVDKHTIDIKANADGLKLKAEASAVNTLTGTVNTHTNQISANATAISARLTSAQVDSLVAGKNYVNQTTLNATANGLRADITQVQTVVNAVGVWNKAYRVNTATPINLTTPDGSDLDDWKSYEVQGQTTGTGSVTTAIAVFKSKRPTAEGWELVKVSELGSQSSNYPEFFIDSNGKPSVRLYAHASLYYVDVTHTAYQGRNTPLLESESKYTTIEATVNGIQTTVGNKADKSQITQLSTQISSKVESATYNSKMTQLDSAINLRVQKGDVIGQINVEAGKTLIQNKSLYLDAATVTFSGKAFIPSAAITALAADKITAGTINAANVKLINLDANQIKAGTISGSNLSLNLNTGEVLFQKGIIKSSDSLLAMDITNKRFESYDSRGGFTLENGAINLRKKPLIIDPSSANRSEMYGKIDYGNNFWSGLGMTVEGTDGLFLQLKGFSQTLLGSRVGSAGMAMNKGSVAVEAMNKVFLRGGLNYTNGVLPTLPEVAVGVDHKNSSVTAGADVRVSGAAVRIESQKYNLDMLPSGLSFSVGTLKVFAVGGDSFKPTFDFGGPLQHYWDSAGGYLRSMSVYTRTNSAAPNLFVTNNGVIGRSTSASKYKLNISEIPDISEYSAKLLSIKPKQWFDKSSVESYAEELSTKGKGRVDNAPITPFYGLIAEDLVAAGLEKYVQYGEDGKEVEGIMYDRLWTLLIPIVKQQKEDIAVLQNKLRGMENVK